jgi:CspA family cold shock protein
LQGPPKEKPHHGLGRGGVPGPITDRGGRAPDGGGSDVFVHVHEVESAGMKTLVKGQLLTYNTAPTRDGRLKAVNLRLLSR